MQVVNVAITFILISSIIVLFFKNMRLKYKNVDLLNNILRIQLEKVNLSNKLEDLSNDDKETSDGFIRFISESREQAYQYIEESQSLLKQFVVYLDKNIEYLKNNKEKDIKYRLLIKDIEQYHKKIKQLLPKDF